jgi:transcriptional regulator with XRE-family HTH domain
MAKTTDDQGRGLWRAPAGSIDRLLKDKGWTRERLAELSGVSEKTIYNLEKQGVSRAKLVEIATTFGLPPESMAVQVTEAGEMERFYPLVGLKAEPPVALSDSEPYQDWTQDGDDQVIEYLWAEAMGSSIQAEVPPKKEEKSNGVPAFFRVSFKNVKGSYPGNVAIHPRGMRAVAAAEKRLLVFQARLAERKDPEYEQSGIGIAVRVRDARLEHWQYKVGDDNYVLEDITKEAPKWQTFEVDLTAGSEKWNKLTMGPLVDGQTPDFSVITGIVFEFGQRGRLRRPDEGQGIVDVGGIFLKET